MKRFKVFICIVVVLLSLGTLLTSCAGDVFNIDFVVDGKTVSTIKSGGNATIALPPDPVKTNYVFDGWFLDRDVWAQPVTALTFQSQPIKRNLLVYAKWLSPEELATVFTITFNTNGGSVVADGKVKYGGLIVEPTPPVRDGYLLTGWYKEANFLTKWNFAMEKVKVNTALYAKWNTVAEMSDVTLKIDKSIAVNKTALSAKVANNIATYNVVSKVSVAKYSTLKICADMAGVTPITVVDLPLQVGDNTLYLLVQSGSGLVKETYTLTVRRRPMYSATFMHQNGIKEVVPAEEDSFLAARNLKTEDEYTFEGWTTAAGKWDFANTAVKGDVTLTYAPTKFKMVDAKGAPNELGGYLMFGCYPQTIKAKEVTVQETNMDARGYFLGSDGYRYAKVIATPYLNDYRFSSNATIVAKTAYYFKVMPLRWRILKVDEVKNPQQVLTAKTALLLCDMVVDNQCYDLLSNKYTTSSIYKWLNEQFYKTAFNTAQQVMIPLTQVDNSAASTGYNINKNQSPNTTDKVFLPSFVEVTSAAYGFQGAVSRSDGRRKMLTTDYSRSHGVWISTEPTRYGNGGWLTRSPQYDEAVSMRYVDTDGFAANYYLTKETYFGVVPAISLNIL